MMFCLLWIVAFVIIYLIYEKLRRKPQIQGIHDKYVLITGCDTGFGRHAAVQFDKVGCHVIAGCLTETAVAELGSEASSRLLAIQMDVSDDASVAAALSNVKAHLPSETGLWAVINNAGVIGSTGPLEWMTPEQIMAVFNINFYGMLRVTKAFLPLLKKTPGSRLVNTASVVGRSPLPYTGAYSLSKVLVEAFSDNLRRELSVFGISVHIIEPGAHKTSFLDKTRVISSIKRTWDSLGEEMQREYGKQYLDKVIYLGTEFTHMTATSTPEGVVAAYQHAVFAKYPKTRYSIGADSVLYILGSYLPSWLTDLVFYLPFLRLVPASVAKR